MSFIFSEILSTEDGPASGNSQTPKDIESHSDEDDEETYPALGDALTQLGLPEYVDLFETEEMDMETFVSLKGWGHNQSTSNFEIFLLTNCVFF